MRIDLSFGAKETIDVYPLVRPVLITAGLILFTAAIAIACASCAEFALSPWVST